MLDEFGVAGGKESKKLATGWRRRIGCLIFTGILLKKAFCGKRPATGRAASAGALAPEPAMRHKSQTTDPTDRVSLKHLSFPFVELMFEIRCMTSDISDVQSGQIGHLHVRFHIGLQFDDLCEIERVDVRSQKKCDKRGVNRGLRDTRSVGSVV